jgi:hypothetical protein
LQYKRDILIANKEMLAGLSIVNEGDAPGRPLGVELRSLLMGGPQRAIR